MNTIAKTLFFIIILTFANNLLAEDKFKVGIVLPLSGPVAPMGEAFRRGVELWQGQKPNDTEKLEIIFEDHRYDGKDTISAAQKLVEINKVQLLVVWGNTPSGVIAPIVEQKKVPTILVSMNPDALNREYVITLSSKVDLLTSYIAKFFKYHKSVNPAAVSIDIGNAVTGVKLLSKELNGQLLENFVPNDTADFNSTIAKLKSKQVDAVYLLTMPEQAITFARQAAAQKFIVPIIGGDIFADSTFQELFIALSSKLAFAYASIADSFIATLQAKFNNISYFGESASGWVCLDLISQLSQLAKKDQSKDYFSYLSKAELDNLPIEKLEFVKDKEFGRHLKHQVAVYSNQGGKLVKDF